MFVIYQLKYISHPDDPCNRVMFISNILQCNYLETHFFLSSPLEYDSECLKQMFDYQNTWNSIYFVLDPKAFLPAKDVPFITSENTLRSFWNLLFLVVPIISFSNICIVCKYNGSKFLNYAFSLYYLRKKLCKFIYSS